MYKKWARHLSVNNVTIVRQVFVFGVIISFSFLFQVNRRYLMNRQRLPQGIKNNLRHGNVIKSLALDSRSSFRDFFYNVITLHISCSFNNTCLTCPNKGYHWYIFINQVYYFWKWRPPSLSKLTPMLGGLQLLF